MFIDDIDGSEAEGTVGFGLDGAHYEIDLSQVHARSCAPSWPAMPQPAARSPEPPGARPAQRGKAAAGGQSTTEIRDWARANGLEVKDRGRIPADVVAGFQAATGQVAPVAAVPAPGGDIQ